ncbi:peptidoglycan-binding protein [Oceanobacillus timonensis]|uniref:peptidoglycan-binding protein n=1 Tax=Oceanobacillus timonensis TaxID=1926285 RepID=UPI00117C343A|nr:peptidoglycan-binding protein [Oceanobacillus timonensis]
MRRKWFPFFLIILLVASPFASVSEVYGMSNPSKEDEEKNDREGRNKESGDEQDSSTDETVSEEIKLEIGEDSEEIQELKEDLTELGFATLEEPTSYFGLHTEEAVKAFQTFYELEDTGIADEDTLLTIEYILSDDSFDREEHLEFSKPEEFVTEEEEVEELPETEEGSEEESEESTESEEGSEEESEENTESEEGSEEESEESTESEEGSEESTESKEGSEEESEESTESEEDAEEESEEGTESEEGSEEEAEESTETEESDEEDADVEEDSEVSIQNFSRSTVFSANGTFKQGDRHEDIVELKQQLNAIGFGYITETTLFGSFMETQVKRFQSYYGLTANGQMNQATKNKLNSVYNNPLQRGKRHDDIPEIKRQLNSLGYGHITVTTLFGSFMEKKIKEFQKDQGLRVSGIADEVTVSKLKELAPKDTYQRGDRNAEIIEFKQQLNAIGFGYITETTLFGSFMETQVKKFQSYYGLSQTGKINKATKEKLNSVYNNPLQRGKRHDDIPEIKRQLNSLGYGYITVTTLFGSFMEQKIKEFQKDQGLRVSGIADEVTVAKLKEIAPKDTYQRGDRHADMIKFKQQLNAIGFGYITETTLFGSFMETQVKRFQAYYGLSQTGKINKATKEKLNSVYNNPLQRGKRHDDIPEIKRQLNSLGYGYITVTTLFGSFMEQKIKEFQKDQGLRVSGIADEITVAKLKELAPKDTYQRGDRHADMIKFKQQLNAIGFGYITETTLFGSFMETQVKRFQAYYGLSQTGKINKATKNKLNSVYNSPFQRGKRHNDIPEIKRQLNTLGYGYITVTTLFGSYMESQVKQFQRDNNLRVNGIVDEKTMAALDEAIDNRWVVNHESYNVTLNQALNTQMNQLQQTDMYRNDAAYVHKNYVNGSNTTTANVNVRSSASNSSHIFGQLSKGTRVTILGTSGNWYRISYGAWRNPTRSDVSRYLNPENNDIFQHLDLTSSVGVTASSLNSDILSGKGILAGRGQAFITAGSRHDVNEIYLISHALLETGNGSSALAKGIEVGLNSSGNPVVVTSSNRSSLRNIKTTYNIYGIGAVDSNPRNGGAVRAYQEGWFSPEQAIIGGAKFIGDSYIHNSYDQNTLYKMRWNPANPGYPQYATDIGWAVKQVPSIKRLYDMLDNPVFNFNVTQYR